jgi:hypothetical protein
MKFTAPEKTSSVPQQGGGLYVGTVTSIRGNYLFVEIPAITPGFNFGPCLSVLSPISRQIETESATQTIPVTGEPQTITVNDPAQTLQIATLPRVGSKVFCAFVNGGLDEVIVLGEIA